MYSLYSAQKAPCGKEKVEEKSSAYGLRFFPACGPASRLSPASTHVPSSLLSTLMDHKSIQHLPTSKGRSRGLAVDSRALSRTAFRACARKHKTKNLWQFLRSAPRQTWQHNFRALLQSNPDYFNLPPPIFTNLPLAFIYHSTLCHQRLYISIHAPRPRDRAQAACTYRPAQRPNLCKPPILDPTGCFPRENKVEKRGCLFGRGGYNSEPRGYLQ